MEWLAKSNGESLVDHTVKVIKYAWELGKRSERYGFEDIEKLVKVAFLHDLGKIEYHFQKRLIRNNPEYEEEKKKRVLQELGTIFGKVEDRGEWGHFHVYLSLLWAVAYGERDKDVLIPVFIHHYTDDYALLVGNEIVGRNGWEEYGWYIWEYVKKMKDLKKYVGDVQKQVVEKLEKEGCPEAAEIVKSMALQEEFFDRIREESEFAELPGQESSALMEIVDAVSLDKLSMEDTSLWEISGLLKRADHLASAGADVAIGDRQDLIEDELKTRIIEKLRDKSGKKEIDLWQEEVIRNLRDYAIVTAPTGAGKTELALLWAVSCKDHEKKASGRELLFTVPIRAALNDLYKNRFKEYFGDRAGLLHSTAFMEYVRESLGEDVSAGTKVVLARNLAYPYLLSTPDQVLLTSLAYFGFDKVVSKYRTSAIVLDEIQGYTPDMLAVTVRSLRIAKKMGAPILVMTATLPAHVFRLLKNIDNLETVLKDISGSKPCEESSVNENEGENTAKVRDIYADKTLKEKLKIDKTRHNVVFVDYELVSREYTTKKDGKERKVRVDVKDIVNGVEKESRGKKQYYLEPLGDKFKKLRERLEWSDEFKSSIEFLAGKKDKSNENGEVRKVLVVLNTVKGAIAFYEMLKKLKERLNEDDESISLYLFHSRLPEARKLGLLEKVKDKNNKRWVLVATQVVEASVDVDADFMITELAPIDSLVQRWGRVYRRREYGGEEPNIVVVRGDRYAEGVYTAGSEAMRLVMEKTKEVLAEYAGTPLTPIKEKEMVEKVFCDKEIYKRFLSEFKEIYGALELFSAAKRSEAQRIFRHLAGIQVVFPALLREKGEEIWESVFGGRHDYNSRVVEMLVNKIENRTRDSWSSIIDEIKDKTNENYTKEELRALVHGASVNVPFYYLQRGISILGDWKGYLVTNVRKDMDKLWEYGLDYVSGSWEDEDFF